MEIPQEVQQDTEQAEKDERFLKIIALSDELHCSVELAEYLYDEHWKLKLEILTLKRQIEHLEKGQKQSAGSVVLTPFDCEK